MRRSSRIPGFAALLAACLVSLAHGHPASAGSDDAELERVRSLYLDAIQRSLLDLVYENDPKVRAQLAGEVSMQDILRGEAYSYPTRARTMIGIKRLENIRALVGDVIAKRVPGDLLEAGAWRGGATIYMRAVLEAHGVRDRTVWVADSFEGLPAPNAEQYPADDGLNLHENTDLAVSISDVRRNFERYGLLDDQVKFLKGWFKDTFPDAPIEKLAVLRLDGDLYESTMDSLVPLYPKVSSGGYVIVDDYKIIAACRKAVDDYRAKHGIDAPLVDIDWNAVYWQKP